MNTTDRVTCLGYAELLYDVMDLLSGIYVGTVQASPFPPLADRIWVVLASIRVSQVRRSELPTGRGS